MKLNQPDFGASHSNLLGKQIQMIIFKLHYNEFHKETHHPKKTFLKFLSKFDQYVHIISLLSNFFTKLNKAKFYIILFTFPAPGKQESWVSLLLASFTFSLNIILNVFITGIQNLHCYHFKALYISLCWYTTVYTAISLLEGIQAFFNFT